MESLFILVLGSQNCLSWSETRRQPLSERESVFPDQLLSGFWKCTKNLPMIAFISSRLRQSPVVRMEDAVPANTCYLCQDDEALLLWWSLALRGGTGGRSWAALHT